MSDKSNVINVENYVLSYIRNEKMDAAIYKIYWELLCDKTSTNNEPVQIKDEGNINDL